MFRWTCYHCIIGGLRLSKPYKQGGEHARKLKSGLGGKVWRKHFLARSPFSPSNYLQAPQPNRKRFYFFGRVFSMVSVSFCGFVSAFAYGVLGFRVVVL